MSLTDEQLREWAFGVDDLAFNEQQCRATAAELLALRARVAKLEAALQKLYDEGEYASVEFMQSVVALLQTPDAEKGEKR